MVQKNIMILWKDLKTLAIRSCIVWKKTINFMEGYSFGSKGRALFQIAENGGILKYRLQEKYGQIEVIPPANIKKFATGKGNADKEKMYEQFKKDTNIDLMKALDQETLASPVTDIVDAYYIAQYGKENIKSTKSS